LSDDTAAVTTLLTPTRRHQPVSSLADVQSVIRGAGDSFLLLACDGVWDVMGSAEAIAFIAGTH
jgi:serine/threonine protein phosphatase PrpC